MYTLVIDVGEKLRTVSDPETSAALQEELSQLQQRWGKTQALLEKKKMQFSGTLQVDDALPTCCSGIGSQELPCPTISRAELLLAAGALWGKCLSCVIRASGKLKLWSPDSPKQIELASISWNTGCSCFVCSHAPHGLELTLLWAVKLKFS